MKTDIILCGVGGQGILSIATIIGEAAMNENLYIKQAEVHGMSQRGGDGQDALSAYAAKYDVCFHNFNSSIFQFFSAAFFCFRWRCRVCIHSRRGMMTDVPW